MVEKYLLRMTCLNFKENLTLLNYYIKIKWKIDSEIPQKITKTFFLEIGEELDTSSMEMRYKALSKLLYTFIVPNIENTFDFFDKQIEDKFLKVNINDAFDYEMLPE